jgi:thioredoxin-like negative regulator of GroEL
MRVGHSLLPLLRFAVLAAMVGSAQSQQVQPNLDPAVEEHLKKGYDAMAAGKYKEAIRAFKKANQLQHNSCDVCYLGLAAANLKLGEFTNAAGNCDKALLYASDDHKRALAHKTKGEALVAEGGANPQRLKDAESEFRAAAQLEKEEPEHHLNLGITLLKQMRDEEGLQELSTYLSLAPGGLYAEMARKMISNPRRARENFAPEFRVTTLLGETLSLAQLSRKIVVLDFWATWCHPCVEALPDLKELVRKYSPEQFALISISADSDEQSWREFVAKKSMTWPQVWDSDRRIREVFSVNAFPTYIVLDGEGVIRQRIIGTNPQQSVAYRLKSALEALPQLKSRKENNN